MGLNEAQIKERSEYLEKNLEITECSQRKPYVFISYASDNWETVFKSAVVPMQKQYGLRVYADKAFDKVNDKWIVPMLRNVRGADVMIAFVSQRYIESYACFLELLTAVNNKKQIVFVSLENRLHLGDTTDLPEMERGVKNEILNQGANIATNTNNTSNDLMRAMKSAFTSISTLLEQDALSKYDISDAFINFFRDASINRKNINDLIALRGTINSVSGNVFDKSLITSAVPEMVNTVQNNEPAGHAQDSAKDQQPVQRTVSPSADQQPVKQAVPQPAAQPVQQFVPQPEVIEHKTAQESVPIEQQPVKEAEIKGNHKGKLPIDFHSKKIGIIAAVAVVILLAVIGVSAFSSKSVKDATYTSRDGVTGTYTGEWKNGMPNGKGTIEWETGYGYEGEWKDGEPNGQGSSWGDDGSFYRGEWMNGMAHGQGTFQYANGNNYVGEWAYDYPHGKGTMKYTSGAVYEGEWDEGYRHGFGTFTWADGSWYEGEWKDDVRCGNGKMKNTNGDVYEGEWANDDINGVGTCTYADGTVKTGTWQDGTLVE